LYALSKPNLFTASSTLLPVANTSASLAAQYAGIASLAGISLPGASSSDPTVKITAILKSRDFAERLITQENLIPQLVEHPEKIKEGTPLGAAVDKFRKDVFSTSTDAKTGVITVSAKTKKPDLSSDIVNKAVALLQQDLQQRVLSVSGKNIALLEQQVADQELKVRQLQAKMVAYQKKNKLVSPQAQSQGGLELYQSLIQQKIGLEVELSRLGSALSADNPKLVAVQTELDAVKKQIADLEKTGAGVGPALTEAPATMVEYGNISSELQLATQLYGQLLGSLESQRLQEKADRIFVEVIDPAIPPEKKSEPARAQICVVGTLAGFFVAILIVFAMDAIAKLAADPEVRAKFAKRQKR
jgi:uncharacterized protein involved in exopolysaccharide biosynthesis